MPPIAYPGRFLKRELVARKLSANRLSIDIGVPSGRITDILNGRRSITADTAVRLGRYFGNRAQFWLDLQSQYDIAMVEREKGRDRQARVASRRGGILFSPQARSQSLHPLPLRERVARFLRSMNWVRGSLRKAPHPISG